MQAGSLDELGCFDRMIVRSVAMLAGGCIGEVEGVANILPDRDPFVLVANHSTRREAVLLPMLLLLLRGGRHVHFLADWNFQLVPGVSLLYRAAQVIRVPNKPARPRLLEVLRPLLTDRTPPLVAARQRLADGRSIGIFPEGTVNRDPQRLRRGHRGAAQLSLELKVPVVPVGLRFAAGSERPLPLDARLSVTFGAPLFPPAGGASSHEWHAAIMSSIAAPSHKISPFDEGADHAGPWHYAQQARRN